MLLTNDQHIKSLAAKNLELSTYLIAVIERHGDLFISQEDLAALSKKVLVKTILKNGDIRISVSIPES